MTKLLTKNRKIMESGKIHNVQLFNYGIPAYKSAAGFITCPAAGACAKGCYATQGAYNFSNVKPAFEYRLEVSRSDGFVFLMQSELDDIKRKANKKGQQVIIRIHDSGDFYSATYLKKWLEIINNNPDVYFYAYTKQLKLFRNIETPVNFRVIFSEGGIFDSLIDETDFHSRVFESVEDLEAAGYANATEDDLVAGIGSNHKIGLVYHGLSSKKFTTAKVA